MTVRDIILAHLRKVGADGLCFDGCGCSVDDLMPCGGDTGGVRDCEPARKTIATAEHEDANIADEGEEIFIPMEKEDEK
jgi:hypothetical protein